MPNFVSPKRLIGAALALGLIVAGAGILSIKPDTPAHADGAGAAPAEQAMPVDVATVESRDLMIWEEFSGRLEAVERVELRPRTSGLIQAVHFREGDLVKQGDLLVTIDPAPYAAEVDRAEAQVAAAEARLALSKSELERGNQLASNRVVSQRDLDQRINANREAEANLRATKAALQSAKLRLDYTDMRAPVAGRVGELEITVGNLVGEGPTAPILTTLVSVDPIYASFNVNEQTVLAMLQSFDSGGDAHSQVNRIPVEMETVASNGTPIVGKLQLIDNQVDASSGTVRVRAVFPNPEGAHMPGQFVRLRLGQAKPASAIAINERAIGTDQDKKFVLIVNGESRADYRPITLGAITEGLRIVTEGLQPGDRIVVNGLQRIRPGALVAPNVVSMDGKPDRQAQASQAEGDVARR